MCYIRVLFMITLAAGQSAWAANTTSAVAYKGYLIDLYCYGLNNAGGRALDGTNVIDDPSQHSLHCLRDPRACRNGYYLAIRNNITEKYDIKFQFDTIGNNAALALLDSLSGDRKPGFFTVTASGYTTGDGVLRGVEQMSECFPSGSADCDGACSTNTSSGCDTVEAAPVQLIAQPLLIVHVVCMLTSWGCLLPLGVLWARNMRNSKKKMCDTPLWFQGHRILQTVGWTLQLVGFLAVFFAKGGFGAQGHFETSHEIIGLIVVIIGTLQPLNAQLRHIACVGHPPKAGEEKKIGRLVWEILHKGLGYSATILGAINVVLGIVYAANFGFRGALVNVAIGFAALSLGSQSMFAVGSELSRMAQRLRHGKGSSDEELGSEDASVESSEEVTTSE